MRGPSITTPQNQSQSQNQSISSLLNGLKAKQLDSNTNAYNNESSTISIDDFKDLTNARIPTKSKRRQKSDKNIVSLDI